MIKSGPDPLRPGAEQRADQLRKKFKSVSERAGLGARSAPLIGLILLGLCLGAAFLWLFAE